MDNCDIFKPNSEVKPFEESGECSDEVVCRFNDGKKVYVSQNFLSYASPVFKAMIKEDFEEGSEREDIVIKHESSDFLELLLSLHPGVQKPIDKSNVMSVVSLAEEYQIKPSIKKSKDTMIKWLSSEVDAALKVLCNEDRVKHAKPCLTILIKAISLGYEDVVNHAVSVLARFPHRVFTGSFEVLTSDKKSVFNFVPSKANEKNYLTNVRTKETEVIKEQDDCSSGFSFTGLRSDCPVEDCKNLFESLSEEMKTRLLLQRLKLCDDGKMLYCPKLQVHN